MTDWPVKALGDVCEVLDNLRKPITKRDRTSGDYPYYGATGIVDHVGDYIFDERLVLVGEDGAKWGAGERTAFIAEGKYWVNNHAHVLRCKQGVLVDSWLADFLTMSDLNRYVSGLTVPKLNQGSLVSIEIPVPPLDEQKRIVALLDDATERVTELTACYEQARTHANNLFTSALCDELGSNPDWPVKTLGEICEVFDDGDWIESKDQSRSGVRLIQTGNVGDGEFKDRSDKARFVSESTFSRLRCTEIFPGDLLVSRLPDPVGRACLIPDTGSKMITAVDCTIMRPRREIMLPQLLVSSTQTNSYREQVRAKITGTTRDRISRSNLAEVRVPVPPLVDQKMIVARLDSMRAKTSEMVAAYDAKLTAAKNLRQSILESAFAGDL